MYDLLNDISVLTTIARYNLKSISDKVVTIVSHDIAESIKSKETVTSIDMGFGQLNITCIDGNVLYKFIPSSALRNAVERTYSTGNSDLVKEIDRELGRRVQNTYKDML